jgi:hypothetical protein
MPAPEIILAKVKQFEENREQYRSLSYKETPTRIDFINPFFGFIRETRTCGKKL